MFVNDNGVDVIGQRQPDGTVQFEFKERTRCVEFDGAEFNSAVASGFGTIGSMRKDHCAVAVV